MLLKCLQVYRLSTPLFKPICHDQLCSHCLIILSLKKLIRGRHTSRNQLGRLENRLPTAGRKERSDALNTAIDRMTKKTRDLRRQLRKAVMDHVSDSFLETNVPLLVLIEAAKNGNEKEVKDYAQVFREHANKLIERLEAFGFLPVFVKLYTRIFWSV
ncbi:catenin alpha-1 [Tachysurus ichikawai]